MRIFAQTQEHPCQVLFAFDEVVGPTVERIRWAVAYSTLRGCRRLVDRIVQRIGEGQWAASPKTFITSLDFGLTEPDALRFLADLPLSEVRVANAIGARNGNLTPAKAFHPKMYLFSSPQTVGFVVGSANLTERALLHNTEMVIAGLEVPTNRTWDFAWASIARETEAITPALLNLYSALWTRPRPQLLEPDLDVREREIRPAEKAIFWPQVQNGRLQPGRFQNFWIEAGSMSSGGSNSQLELPRGANRFFGFAHEHYGPGHETIGFPVMTLRHLNWQNRPLTWHGNNRMERINLPTAHQGGFRYAHTAILFRRHPGGFELEVLPWSDSGAIAWRNASDALGTIFRLGRGRRVCGLF